MRRASSSEVATDSGEHPGEAHSHEMSRDEHATSRRLAKEGARRRQVVALRKGSQPHCSGLVLEDSDEELPVVETRTKREPRSDVMHHAVHNGGSH
ncbi:unnamed protein product [Linum trigynum]|uniref:Uncharacterized protein n=1 Tax=Linum trigynum TaxID=586398 RepID=A0AAV2EBM4_9ROSI